MRTSGIAYFVSSSRWAGSGTIPNYFGDLRDGKNLLFFMYHEIPSSDSFDNFYIDPVFDLAHNWFLISTIVNS